MEQNRVKISLRSRHTAGGESEEIRQELEGFLEKEGENWIISWQEPPDGSGDGSSRLALFSGGAILHKTGETASKMVFREGKTHTFSYETPYGSIPMSLTAEKVSSALSPDGGQVELVYALTADPSLPTRVELKLSLLRPET